MWVRIKVPVKILLVRPITWGGVVSALWDGLNLEGFTMSQSSTATETSVEFGAKSLKANAALYHQNKRIVDAASGYDSLDDAIAGLTEAREALEVQAEDGGGFTPPVEMGFGSDNAAVIAESLLGRRNTVGSTRKAFNVLGK